MVTTIDSSRSSLDTLPADGSADSTTIWILLLPNNMTFLYGGHWNNHCLPTAKSRPNPSLMNQAEGLSLPAWPISDHRVAASPAPAAGLASSSVQTPSDEAVARWELPLVVIAVA